MKRIVVMLLVVLAMWQAYSGWRLRSVEPPAGILAPDEPLQTTADKSVTAFQIGDYTVQPMAHYRIRARLLHRKNYYFDHESALSPYDFALGWGAMSDSAILAQLKIGQSSRFYSMSFSQAPPVPIEDLLLHSANTHLIPADGTVNKALRWIRPGQVVEMEGDLVNITAPGGWHWVTSMTRADSGAGACEIFWVQQVKVAE